MSDALTGEAGEEIRCPKPECGGEVRWWYRCEDCHSFIAPRVFHTERGQGASESKSGGEGGAGRTWTIWVCECGIVEGGEKTGHHHLAAGDSSFVTPVRRPIEVCPASDLTKALSLLEGYRTSRDSTREQLEAAEAQLADARAATRETQDANSQLLETAKKHRARADRAEAQLARIVELLPDNDSPDWETSDALDTVQRDAIAQARTALSNTTPETRDGQEENDGS